MTAATDEDGGEPAERRIFFSKMSPKYGLISAEYPDPRHSIFLTMKFNSTLYYNSIQKCSQNEALTSISQTQARYTCMYEYAYAT